jgi:hypothetical protein
LRVGGFPYLHISIGWSVWTHFLRLRQWTGVQLFLRLMRRGKDDFCVMATTMLGR